MKTVSKLFSRVTESVAALMMAAMFATFIIQIIVRYVVGADWFAKMLGHSLDPSAFGWTLEFCLALWVWIVFWGNSFVVRESDHVRFDILFFLVSPKVQRIFAFVGALVVIGAMLYSIEPTYAKMKILRLKSSATLPLKMLPIYSIYFLFLVVVPIRYAWRAYVVARKGLPEETIQ